MVIILNKSLNDMVHVSRAAAGLKPASDDAATTRPRRSALARLRRLARFVPFHRLYHSIELSLLVLVAALVDLGTGDLTGTRVLLVVLVPASLLAVAGHFLAIVSSARLRPSAVLPDTSAPTGSSTGDSLTTPASDVRPTPQSPAPRP